MSIAYESIIRSISLFARHVKSCRKNKERLKKYYKWKSELESLISNECAAARQNKVLIIRLDDIGDYLLFRNTLEIYRKSKRFGCNRITLLGNISWKGLFEIHDSSVIDEIIWINKRQYYDDEVYRRDIWKKLLYESFHTVICPSRTRPLLLDDLCTLAACATTNIAAANSLGNPEHEQISDRLYSSVFTRDDFIHEFEFNQRFAKWCCDCTVSSCKRPFIVPKAIDLPIKTHYLLFCPGTTAKSKKWPVDKWIALMEKCRSIYSMPIVLASGGIEEALTDFIRCRIRVDVITGKTTLPEIANWINNAAMVFAHDSMAAHLAVCCKTSTVIIANGMHYHRFTAYEDSGMDNVKTVLPDVFIKWKANNSVALSKSYMAVTRDITTISVDAVLSKAKELMQEYLRTIERDR